MGDMQNNDALLNLGATVAVLLPADQLWRSAAFYIQSASILAASSTLGAAIPILANAPPTTFLVVWGVLYPLILLGSAVGVFARRDL